MTKYEKTLLQLGKESESAITGMPPELTTLDEAVSAIKTELSYGRQAHNRLRELEHRFGVAPMTYRSS